MTWPFIKPTPGEVFIDKASRLSKGLVGWWLFNENGGSILHDYSGFGNDGTLISMDLATDWVVSGNPAIIGFALNFNGVDSYVDIGSAELLDNVTRKTISAWIFPTGWGEFGAGRIVSKSNVNNNGWSLLIQDGTNDRLYFAQDFSGSGGNAWVTPTGSLSLNVWQHVAVTYDRSSVSNDPVMYIDGSSKTLTQIFSSSGSPTSDAAESLLIGIRNNTTKDRAFDGRIDDVRVFDYMLAANEIASLYFDPFPKRLQVTVFKRSIVAAAMFAYKQRR